MIIASEKQRALPEGRRVAVPLLEASLIASLVFALAWIRWPLSASNVASVAVIFVGYGILVTIFAMVLGFPLTRFLERRRIRRWWSHLAVAAATGAVLAASSRRIRIAGRCATQEATFKKRVSKIPTLSTWHFRPGHGRVQAGPSNPPLRCATLSARFSIREVGSPPYHE
jgi:hypothetical protein